MNSDSRIKMTIHHNNVEIAVSSDEDSVLKTWCEVSTCMGVIDCYLANSLWGKLFWITALLCGLILTVWQVYLSITSFASAAPFQVAVSNELLEAGMDFPNITEQKSYFTIRTNGNYPNTCPKGQGHTDFEDFFCLVCNYNRIKQSLIEKHGLEPQLLSYVFQMFPMTYDDLLSPWPYANTSNLSQTRGEEEAWQKYVSNGGVDNVFDFFRRFSHTKEETFYKATILGVVKVPDEDIKEEFTVYGRCWKIMSLFRQPMPGAGSGVQLVLNPRLDEYMKRIENTFLEEGMFLSFTYADEPFVPKPIILAPDTYTPTNCIYDCHFQDILEICNCSLAVNTNYPYRLCRINEYKTCIYQIILQNINQTKPCYSTCLRPCTDFYEVTATATAAKFLSERQREILNEFVAEQTAPEQQHEKQNIFNNLIKVDIYFPDKEITVAETGESNPLFVFIGNVGGQLGLWTGISLMTLIQCLYYAIIYMCSLHKRMKLRRRQNKIQTIIAVVSK